MPCGERWFQEISEFPIYRNSYFSGNKYMNFLFIEILTIQQLECISHHHNLGRDMTVFYVAETTTHTLYIDRT
jgi:hypothetical protein